MYSKTLSMGLVGLLILSMIVVMAPVNAEHSAQAIWVEPPSINLQPGNDFTVNVKVNISSPTLPGGGTGLFGFEYKLRWNSTVLDVVKINTHGDNAPAGDLPAGWTAVIVAANNTAVPGRHWYAVSALLGTAFTGVYSLCAYTFHVKTLGSCALDIYEEKLVDDKAKLITHTTSDGYFDNRQSSSISISASPTTIDFGENTTISGSITPTRAGVTVTIYYRLTGGNWTTLTTVPTNVASQYSYVWKPATPGTYEVKAGWPGDPATFPAESSIVSIVVEAVPALIFVDPPRLVNLTLVPCENFAVNVSIVDAIGLYSFEFKLGFDPGILSITNATLGDTFPSVTPTMEINNTGGYVWFSASLEPPETGVSGNGTLAVITFHVEGLGACKLTLSDTVITDSTGNPLPHSTSDGYFNNVLLGKLAVDPPEIIDPTLVPPSTFEINVTLADIEDLYGYAFNLSFKPNILACISINIHDVLNETNYTPNFMTDNTKGFVWVNVTYYPPAESITTYSPVVLITIKFRVKAMGVTPLNFSGTSLADSLGQPIPHETFDGFVLIITRDVAVTNVVPSTNETYVGWAVNINVTVSNQGDIAETFNVTAYYDNNVIGIQTVTNLPSGENLTLIFIWNTAGVQPGINYTIKAEADMVPYERDTADNIGIDGKVKIKMLGDINGDRIIDLSDMVIAALAFGSEARDDPTTPWDETANWNSWADLNRDGVVDIVDLVIIGIDFGKTC